MQIRKIVSGVLAFVFLCSTITAVEIVQQRNSQFIAQAEDYGNYTESIYNELTYCAFDDHVVISDCDTSAVEIIIPEEIGSLPVTAIDERAFCYCDNLVSITIPDSVTSIGYDAFSGCTNLQSVHIPVGVTELADSVFSDCSSLTDITIPDNVTNIGRGAFSGCTNLQSVHIPVGVTELASSVFSNCSSLIDITIPDSVTSIGDNAFYGCSSLEKLAIPANTTYLGYDFCSDCSSLTDITVAQGNETYFSIDGALFKYIPFYDLGDVMTLVLCPEGKQGNYTIPEGTVRIGNFAFEGCAVLESVFIPDGVLEIGGSAFRECESLTNVIIPEGVTKVGEHAFRDCTNLKSLQIPSSVDTLEVHFCENCPSLTAIDVASDNNTYFSSDGVLFKNACYDYYREEWQPIMLKVYPEGKQGSYSIPKGVGAINNIAFENCTGLKSVIIPESTVTIGWNAFRNCTDLKYVTVLNQNCNISYYSWLRLKEGGAVYGLPNSTAQDYASDVRYEFRIAGAEEPLSLGDLDNDGVINAADASVILVASANVGAGVDSGLTEAQETAADVNYDGVFNASDSSVILSYAAAAGAGYTESFVIFVEDFLA